jgi:hypothetical protein
LNSEEDMTHRTLSYQQQQQQQSIIDK